jgi:glycosyltransferase involved in cell wall biosynthesis
MQAMRTRISIAMAVYNGERFVSEQLDSFARQTRLPDELVVSDDASTDRSVEIVREFAAHAPFPVRLLANKQNAGPNGNFDRAIDACAGDVIFLSDWDDVQYPDKLLLVEKALRESPRAGVAICNADLVDEDLKPLGRTLWEAHGFFPSRCLQELMSEGTEFTSSLTTNGCCLAFRGELKRLVLPLPGGDPRPILHDGFIAWTIILSGAGGVALVDKPLLAYRQHNAQVSGAGGNTYSRLGRWRARLARAKERPHFGPLIERLESPAAIQCSRNQEIRKSALCHWRARWNLPEYRIARVSPVLQELFTRRYQRFSHGFAAAAKDLLFVR